ncbi:hypothetical protein LCGC14_1324840, partial [marine sediment metagenome]
MKKKINVGILVTIILLIVVLILGVFLINIILDEPHFKITKDGVE